MTAIYSRRKVKGEGRCSQNPHLGRTLRPKNQRLKPCHRAGSHTWALGSSWRALKEGGDMSRVIKPPLADRRALKWGCLCMPLHAFSITPGPAGQAEGHLFYSKLAGAGEGIQQAGQHALHAKGPGLISDPSKPLVAASKGALAAGGPMQPGIWTGFGGQDHQTPWFQFWDLLNLSSVSRVPSHQNSRPR